MENEQSNHKVDDDNLLNKFGPYDPHLDLSNYCYPEIDILPSELKLIFNHILKGRSSYQLPILVNGVNNPNIIDIYQYPNILIAGTTGFGKTQFIYNQIVSWLFSKHPSEFRVIICRNKVIDYNFVNKLEKHFAAKPRNSGNVLIAPNEFGDVLEGLKLELETRLSLFANAGVKNIKDYNNLFVERRLNPEDGHRFLPDIVLIVDDLSNFIDNSEYTAALIHLSQQNLYTGIYIIAATNQINSRSISSQLRANFSMRISMKLMSQSESRKILDKNGAEKLILPGEMLYTDMGNNKNGKQPYIDYSIIDSICTFIAEQRGYPSAYLLPKTSDYPEPKSLDFEDRDSLFEDAARLIVLHQQGSTSLIQRKLKLGYDRAGRIIDQLESTGIVGPFEGSKARDVFYPDEYSLEKFLETLNNKYPTNNKRLIITPDKTLGGGLKQNNIDTSINEKKGYINDSQKEPVVKIKENNNTDKTIITPIPPEKPSKDYSFIIILIAVAILIAIVYFT